MIEHMFEYGNGMAQLRWPQPGDDAQLALLDGAERTVGSGEYRGLEFFEVDAKTLINRVPGGPVYGFEYTINAYRGCSHACEYCFARPTHEYLALGIDTDFETKIVVKRNAVERVRAETAPHRWGGDLLAMGTNTDPYQHAEGKYKLTRGILEILVERRNPFSILTKSTLVLRDLDVLVTASRVMDIAVDFSIGTIDPRLWRSTERGAPHPQRRMEAVAKLNAAGVPSGVLMGPILPGLSDDANHIDDVVAAALGAGATSIAAVPLHLKPGLRRHFMSFLADEHPELVIEYERRFRDRAFQARHHQQRIVEMVREAVQRHGGIRNHRRRPVAARRLQPPVATQLTIEGIE